MCDFGAGGLCRSEHRMFTSVKATETSFQIAMETESIRSEPRFPSGLELAPYGRACRQGCFMAGRPLDSKPGAWEMLSPHRMDAVSFMAGRPLDSKPGAWEMLSPHRMDAVRSEIQTLYEVDEYIGAKADLEPQVQRSVGNGKGGSDETLNMEMAGWRMFQRVSVRLNSLVPLLRVDKETITDGSALDPMNTGKPLLLPSFSQAFFFKGIKHICDFPPCLAFEDRENVEIGIFKNTVYCRTMAWESSREACLCNEKAKTAWQAAWLCFSSRQPQIRCALFLAEVSIILGEYEEASAEIGCVPDEFQVVVKCD
ncbi:hypothetical protein E5288_WYG018533 [Bos mutus]|uniref:Uncharacterized protein n=1 Tax=Bos mutus TaxID=72004 RepID=A0A6B0S577_9CETA|nr:hypothetical protein [Bos mutus]